jgi:phenylpyruvate tautomerase PptA (4-oxalocrotonate tautomerase family)
MPFVRVDLVTGKSPAYKQAIGDVIYDAMVEILTAPVADRFQVFNELPRDNLVADETYLGIRRTKDCVFIQIFLLSGRTQDQKKTFYKVVADRLHERTGIRREDVFVGLVEVSRENWSFGNGEAQYV